MHGNVAEWVASDFKGNRKMVKGGSWYDRPLWATADKRIGYHPWQKVYNVGFRVIFEE